MSMLKAKAWSGETRQTLQRLIIEGAGQKLAAVFDFDNTLVCGDIGEATFALMLKDGILKPGGIPAAASTAFTKPDGSVARIETVEDLARYYEALLEPTVHGAEDPAPLASGYAWAVQAMAGLRVSTVVSATQQVWAASEPYTTQRIQVSHAGPSYPVPWFYPEMVELLAMLIESDFQVYVVSASNVWSVRWMMCHALSPYLRELGVRNTIPPQNVIGISTLLAGPDRKLYKDSVLVTQGDSYAALATDARDFVLTDMLQFPVTCYSGKIGAVWDLIGSSPYLGAGDSPGDLPMLSFCRNRLWLARPAKARFQHLMQNTKTRFPGEWIVHHVCAGQDLCHTTV